MSSPDPHAPEEAAAGPAGLGPSDAAKIASYEDAHAVAVELGYPSLTEALEDLSRRPPPASETALPHWEWSNHTAEGMKATLKALTNVADDYPVQAHTLRTAMMALVAASGRADNLQAKLDAAPSETALVKALEWYSKDDGKYNAQGGSRHTVIGEDSGKRARTALAAHRAQQEGRR